MKSKSPSFAVIGAFAVVLGLAGAANAQPGDNSPNQFGDRQAGHWGDPGKGQFGNPAAGDFDKSKLLPPPDGVKPLGKVYGDKGKVMEASPYVSLPTPVDANGKASQPAEATKKPAKTKKPPAKKPAAR